jgi:hypothetical protein
MQFIHVIMLLGLLAIAIPIIIQLLTRRTQKKIMWGAFIFIKDSMKKRRKRVLLEEILLLACRCLIPALLALGFARPFIQPNSSIPWVVVMPIILLAIALLGISFALWNYPKWRKRAMTLAIVLLSLASIAILFERKLNLKRFGRGAAKDVVLVIDGSASMSMLSDGESNFEHAKAEARKYIEEAPRGTSFSIILGGPVAQVLNPVPIEDKRVLLDTLERVHITDGTMQIMHTLTSAAVTLASGHNAVKQIIIIGDGQVEGWNIESTERWQTIKQIFSTLPMEPTVIWRTLPLPVSIRNLAVSNISLSRNVIGTDRQVRIQVTVVNSGSEAVTPENVTLSIGTKVIKASEMRQLEPGASQTFNFDHTFETSGATIITAKIVANDDLPSDDTFRYVVPVMDNLKVLVVDGTPSPDVFKRGSTFISLALRPEMAKLAAAALNKTPDEERDFLLETTVKDFSQLNAIPNFDIYSVVILANVPKMSEDVLNRLSSYVARGGGLLVLPGARADKNLYNKWLFNGTSVLPLKLGQWKKPEAIPVVVDNENAEANAANKQKVESIHIDTFSFAHDSLRKLRYRNDLMAVSPLFYWELEQGISGEEYVAARFSNEMPFIAIKQLERGTVALSAIPFDTSVSEIVAKKTFVPMVHEIVYHLARPISPELNTIPSDSATLLLSPQLSASVANSEGGDGYGLVGQYYPNKNFSGVPVKRIDNNLNLNFGNNSPIKGIGNDQFSVEWVGTITPKETSGYVFNLHADDRAQLFVQTQSGEFTELINVNCAERESSVVYLKQGVSYPIRIRLAEETQEAFMRLRWRKQNGSLEAIPSELLSPAVVRGAGMGDIVEVKDPFGDIFHAEVFQSDNGMVLGVSRSLMPGLYTVTVPESLKTFLGSIVTEENTIIFSVEAGVAESHMESINLEQTELLTNYIILSVATKEDDVHKAIMGQAFGKEIWRILAIAAFLFLIAEVILTRWIAIQRRTGEKIDVDFKNDKLQASESFKENLSKVRSQEN